MTAYTIAMVITGVGALDVVVWLLAKVGKVLVTIGRSAGSGCGGVPRRVAGRHGAGVGDAPGGHRWRTSLTVLALLAWWGWGPLVSTVGSVVLALAGWRLVDLASFDAWAGRHLRAWGLRWTGYAPRLPGWLYACGLSSTDHTFPVVVSGSPWWGARRSAGTATRPQRGCLRSWV